MRNPTLQIGKTLNKWFALSKKLITYRSSVLAGALFLILAGSFVIGATDKGLWVIAGVLGLVLSLSIFVRPHIGVYTLTLFIYMNMSTVLTEAFGIPSLNKILVVLIFVSVLATRIMMQKKPLIFRWTEGLILFYIVVISVSTLMSSGINTVAFDNIVDIIKDFLIILIVIQLSTEEKVWKNIQWILIVSAAVLSLLTWYQYLTDHYEQNFYGLATSRIDYVENDIGGTYTTIMRVGGPVGDPNYYAMILLMVFPMGFYRFLDDDESQLVRGLVAAALILIAGAILFSYSRATLMVLILIIGLILLERRIDLYKIVIGSLVLFMVASPVLPEGYLERMFSLFGLNQTSEQRTDDSAQGRLSEALVAMQMFTNHPIIGIGYSQYESNYQEYSSKLGLDTRLEKRQAHNLYLESLAETGLVGTTAFAMVLIAILQVSLAIRREAKKIGRADLIPWMSAVQFGLLAYLINSIYLHDDYSRYMRLAIAIVLGSSALIFALRDQYKAISYRARLNEV